MTASSIYNLVFYFTGIFTGVAGFYLVALNFANKEAERKEAERLQAEIELEEARKKSKEEDEKLAGYITAMANEYQAAKKAVAEADKVSSIQQRLKQAIEITTKQSKIDTKRVLQGDEQTFQYQNLELEKLSILRTILQDGFDPVITVRYDDHDAEMQLSAYINKIQKGMN